MDCGFFYVVNHGVEPAMEEEVLAQSRAFFALPAHEKMKVARHGKRNYRGYTPFEDETLDPSTQVTKGNCSTYHDQS